MEGRTVLETLNRESSVPGEMCLRLIFCDLGQALSFRTCLQHEGTTGSDPQSHQCLSNFKLL